MRWHGYGNNLVCGFDILGLALNEPFDIMEVWANGWSGVTIQNRITLICLPGKKKCGRSSVVCFGKVKKQQGYFCYHWKAHQTPWRGLGSSAASAAGAAVGLIIVVGKCFQRRGCSISNDRRETRFRYKNMPITSLPVSWRRLHLSVPSTLWTLYRCYTRFACNGSASSNWGTHIRCTANFETTDLFKRCHQAVGKILPAWWRVLWATT